MRLFEGVLRFARTGSGDVNAVQGECPVPFGSVPATTASCSSFNRTACASSAFDTDPRRTAKAGLDSHAQFEGVRDANNGSLSWLAGTRTVLSESDQDAHPTLRR